MSFHNQRPARLGFWSVLFLSVFAWAPTTYPGYWQALEGFLPAFNAVNPSAISRIATMPDLWRGTGRATFVLVQPLLLLGATPIVAVRVTFALCFILGGLGVYIWLQVKLGDRAAGLAGLVYVLWPPFLATVYIRGSLDDALVLALLPLALAGLAIYAETGTLNSAAVLTLSLLWMWRTQAGLSVFVTLILIFYALMVERSYVAALVTGVSGAAGLVSLIPLWSIQSIPTVVFADHFIYPFQLLYGEWQVRPSIAGWQDDYPFQLGLAALLFAATAVWLWWTEGIRAAGRSLTRLLAFCLVVITLFILMALPISASVWGATYATRLLDYPWQLLLLAGPFLAAIAGALPALSPGLRRPSYWAVLAAVTVIASYPFLTTKYTQVAPPPVPVGIFGESNEIVVLDTAFTEDTALGEVELSVVWQVVQTPVFDYNVFFQAVTPGADNELAVRAQLDAQPLQGLEPATTWQPGAIYTDTYRLILAESNGQDASLDYYFGYYDWRDGTRMPLNGGIDDKLVFYGK